MSDLGHFTNCAECGHRAWPHGDQSGFPASGQNCYAAIIKDGLITDEECPCPGYRSSDLIEERT